MNTDTTQISPVPSSPSSAPLTIEPSPSRQPKYGVRKEKGKSRQIQWGIASLCFILGVVLGVWVMYHREQRHATVFTVNGESIMQPQLFDALQSAAGVTVMQQLVDDKLLTQFAKSLGLFPTPDQVAARLKELKAAPNYNILLTQSKLTEQQFAERLPFLMCKQAIYGQGITVSDAEVKAFYNSESTPSNAQALFYRPAVITLETVGSDTLQDSQIALQKLNSGMTFDMVAEQYSVDATRINGGHIDPLIYGQSPLHQYPSVEQQLFNLQVGQQIGPVTFGQRWWIFRCLESSPPLFIPLSSVEDQARIDAIESKGARLNGAAISQKLAAFQHSSTLQAFWPMYSGLAAKH